jgi:hypothetical protein
LVDGDPIKIIISKRLIPSLNPSLQQEEFLVNEKALERFKSLNADENKPIFLYINRPMVNAGDFLKKYPEVFKE